jgi:hypothetical protein
MLAPYICGFSIGNLLIETAGAEKLDVAPEYFENPVQTRPRGKFVGKILRAIQATWSFPRFLNNLPKICD